MTMMGWMEQHQKSHKDHDELDSMSWTILLLLLVVLVDMDIIKMLLITSNRDREHIVDVAR